MIQSESSIRKKTVKGDNTLLTVDALKEYGADTAQGLSRCMNNEGFYVRLVGMLASDQHAEELVEAVSAGDLKKGFEAAHALKGVLANLALTPALEPVSEITEYLRAGKVMDYTPLMERIVTEMARLKALING